jgi:2-dehydro-3-deoxyphosphooctonate aldolase (KDO 8-P synthase)
MRQVVAKAGRAAVAAGYTEPSTILTERGTSFGHNNLVVDMRGLAMTAENDCPVIFDAARRFNCRAGLVIVRAGSGISFRWSRALRSARA